MKQLVKRLINGILFPLGLRITRKKPNLNPYFHDIKNSFVISEKIEEQFEIELVNTIYTTFKNSLTLKQFSWQNIASEVSNFLTLYKNRPIVFDDNAGGSGFDNSLWIYIVNKLLQPSLIVESGVWKGQTSWILESACPESEIHGFDISLKELKHESTLIDFHATDWSTYYIKVYPGKRGLCFFDCHINHIKRLKEAQKRGFEFVLLDDNVPAHLVHAFASPPLPSLEMALNGNFKVGDEIEWLFRGNRKSYKFDETILFDPSELIDEYIIFPDIGTRTRYGKYSFLSWVKLKI